MCQCIEQKACIAWYVSTAPAGAGSIRRCPLIAILALHRPNARSVDRGVGTYRELLRSELKLCITLQVPLLICTTHLPKCLETVQLDEWRLRNDNTPFLGYHFLSKVQIRLGPAEPGVLPV